MEVRNIWIIWKKRQRHQVVTFISQHLSLSQRSCEAQWFAHKPCPPFSLAEAVILITKRAVRWPRLSIPGFLKSMAALRWSELVAKQDPLAICVIYPHEKTKLLLAFWGFTRF